MAINNFRLEQELKVTSGEYFCNNVEIIKQAIQTALDQYSSYMISEKAVAITTSPSTLTTEYNLPADFGEVISIYKHDVLYAALYRGGYLDNRDPFYYNTAGGSYYTGYPGSLDKKYYLDTLMDKIEFFSLAEVQPFTIDYHIDQENKKFILNNEPDPYCSPEIYVLHYRAKATPDNVPDYHYEYVYKLASAVLMERQAMAMSKISQTTGPGLKTQFVSPMVLFEMTKKIRDEVINALSRYVPERG